MTDLMRPSVMGTQFPEKDHPYFVLLNLRRISIDEFSSTITALMPKAVFDLRLAPRFDPASMNRSQAFQLFRSMNAIYVDVLGRHSELRNSSGEELGSRLGAILEAHLKPLVGPLILLSDDRIHRLSFVGALLSALKDTTDSSWDFAYGPDLIVDETKHAAEFDVVEVRHFDAVSNSAIQYRDSIFISHANPQQNEFVIWLSSKLNLAGYRVWADITQLHGGETFWDRIEDTIRNRSTKCIFVQSDDSLKKTNVLNELDLALSVERQTGISDFVIPIRVDGSEFDRTYIGLIRRLIVDFNTSWSSGLRQLLEKLEKDNVVKHSAALASENAAALQTALQGSHASIISKRETLLSNWFEVTAVPQKVFFYEFPSVERSMIAGFAKQAGVATFRYERLIGAFADHASLGQNTSFGMEARVRAVIPIGDFLRGSWADIASVPSVVARRYIVQLLRLSWEQYVGRVGFRSYEATRGRKVWFAPRDLIPGNSVQYKDEGRARRRQIVGFSRRQNVHWHFGLEAWPNIDEVWHFVLKPAVIFSFDGVQPLQSDAVMHRLRRSFCKNWWNGRWRDMIIATSHFLSNGKNEYELGAFLEGRLRVSATSVAFESPISHASKGLDPYVVYQTDGPSPSAFDVSVALREDEAEAEALASERNDGLIPT